MLLISRTLNTGLHKTLKFLFIMAVVTGLASCSQGPSTELINTQVKVTGDWILEQDGSSMRDPQTSGLTFHQKMLYSISDGSADGSQIQQLHQIHPQTGALVGRLGPIKLSPKLKHSCFVSYLTTRPDYEAIVSVPGKQNSWLLVTEDATRAGKISEACQKRFANTGSTRHPTLLVMVELIDNELMLTGVRALQFSAEHNIGDFPNDGVEGMTITRDGKVLLGLEKDANTQPRVFEIELTDEFFAPLDDFAPLTDSELRLPEFEEGKHPINGMDVYYPNNSEQGYLIAAARNDDQLWIIDLQKQQSTKILNVSFSVNCRAVSNTENDVNSGEILSTHVIANSALEGVAVSGDTIYLINDPWKKVYADNKTCAADQDKYQQMSPMLFSVEIDKNWLQ